MLIRQSINYDERARKIEITKTLSGQLKRVEDRMLRKYGNLKDPESHYSSQGESGGSKLSLKTHFILICV